MIDPKEKLRIVELTPPNPEWQRLYHDAAAEIQSILKDNLVALYHIGSTSIPNIYAKPIIDMLPVVNELHRVDTLNPEFNALGYECMGEYGIPGRRFYWKSKEKRTHNIHLFAKGSPEIRRHVAFKEFMLKNPDYAQGYSIIKQCLAEVFLYEIEQYVNGKSSFVQMIDYQTGNARVHQLNALDNVLIQPYNPIWPNLAAAEIKAIKQMSYPLPYVGIEHIGSTAAPGLSSKPIIDILIMVDAIAKAEEWIKPLTTLGYAYWDENPDKFHLRFFKGMPPFGEQRTHHVHLVEANDVTVAQRLLFRDRLRVDPKISLDYELLKKKLAELYPTDREAYTEGKTDFIEKVLQTHGYTGQVKR